MKKSDGTIYVIGGDDFDSFYGNMVTLAQGESTFADDVVADMLRCLTPTAASPPPQGGFYTPPGGPGPLGQPQPQHGGTPRVSPNYVDVTIPFPEKAQADPYLAPLKAMKQAQWQPATKQWRLSPGVDLTPFARWLPPGV